MNVTDLIDLFDGILLNYNVKGREYEGILIKLLENHPNELVPTLVQIYNDVNHSRHKKTSLVFLRRVILDGNLNEDVYDFLLQFFLKQMELEKSEENIHFINNIFIDVINKFNGSLWKDLIGIYFDRLKVELSLHLILFFIGILRCNYKNEICTEVFKIMDPTLVPTEDLKSGILAYKLSFIRFYIDDESLVSQIPTYMQMALDLSPKYFLNIVEKFVEFLSRPIDVDEILVFLSKKLVELILDNSLDEFKSKITYLFYTIINSRPFLVDVIIQNQEFFMISVCFKLDEYSEDEDCYRNLTSFLNCMLVLIEEHYSSEFDKIVSNLILKQRSYLGQSFLCSYSVEYLEKSAEFFLHSHPFIRMNGLKGLRKASKDVIPNSNEVIPKLLDLLFNSLRQVYDENILKLFYRFFTRLENKGEEIQKALDIFSYIRHPYTFFILADCVSIGKFEMELTSSIVSALIDIVDGDYRYKEKNIALKHISDMLSNDIPIEIQERVVGYFAEHLYDHDILCSSYIGNILSHAYEIKAIDFNIVLKVIDILVKEIGKEKAITATENPDDTIYKRDFTLDPQVFMVMPVEEYSSILHSIRALRSIIDIYISKIDSGCVANILLALYSIPKLKYFADLEDEAINCINAIVDGIQSNNLDNIELYKLILDENMQFIHTNNSILTLKSISNSSIFLESDELVHNMCMVLVKSFDEMKSMAQVMVIDPDFIDCVRALCEIAAVFCESHPDKYMEIIELSSCPFFGDVELQGISLKISYLLWSNFAIYNSKGNDLIEKVTTTTLQLLVSSSDDIVIDIATALIADCLSLSLRQVFEIVSTLINTKHDANEIFCAILMRVSCYENPMEDFFINHNNLHELITLLTSILDEIDISSLSDKYEHFTSVYDSFIGFIKQYQESDIISTFLSQIYSKSQEM